MVRGLVVVPPRTADLRASELPLPFRRIQVDPGGLGVGSREAKLQNKDKLTT